MVRKWFGGKYIEPLRHRGRRGVVDNTVAVLESRNYDPFGNGFGNTGTSQTGYGFTGELVDGGGLLDLRARRYAAAFGVFASLDPFEGVRNRAMSLNAYSWVEGNVPNAVDPSGYARLDIWVSAFVKPNTLDFIVYYGEIYPPGTGDGYIGAIQPPIGATWHGDRRDFYGGGDTSIIDGECVYPSARICGKVQYDLNNRERLYFETGTGTTFVTFVDQFTGKLRTESRKATPPDANSVSIQRWSDNDWEVGIKMTSANPLSFAGPAIDLAYAIRHLPCENKLEVYAWHDLYPWHELFIQLDGQPLMFVNDAPAGLTQSPADLVFPAIRPTLHIAYHPRLGNK
jgi:RHS repeat-associated protein